MSDNNISIDENNSFNIHFNGTTSASIDKFTSYTPEVNKTKYDILIANTDLTFRDLFKNFKITIYKRKDKLRNYINIGDTVTFRYKCGNAPRSLYKFIVNENLNIDFIIADESKPTTLDDLLKKIGDNIDDHVYKEQLNIKFIKEDDKKKFANVTDIKLEKILKYLTVCYSYLINEEIEPKASTKTEENICIEYMYKLFNINKNISDLIKLNELSKIGTAFSNHFIKNTEQFNKIVKYILTNYDGKSKIYNLNPFYKTPVDLYVNMTIDQIIFINEQSKINNQSEINNKSKTRLIKIQSTINKEQEVLDQDVEKK